MYNIVRKNRSFEIWDNNGNLRLPSEDKLIRMYSDLNSNYPDIDSQHYKEAQDLNIEFFTSSNYPYDYIVLGDRAALEESRKGSYLNPYEEFFITLGYGYDGRPFGEPWDISKECFDGYKYGESQGDFLYWYNNRNYYEKYIQDGHSTPYEHHPSVNRDLRELAERKSSNARKLKYGRITKQIYNELTQNPELDIIRDGFEEPEITKNNIINFNK